MAEMRERMSSSEYVLWTRYHLRRHAEIELERLKVQAKAGM